MTIVKRLVLLLAVALPWPAHAAELETIVVYASGSAQLRSPDDS